MHIFGEIKVIDIEILVIGFAIIGSALFFGFIYHTARRLAESK